MDAKTRKIIEERIKFNEETAKWCSANGRSEGAMLFDSAKQELEHLLVLLEIEEDMAMIRERIEDIEGKETAKEGL